MKPLRKAIIFLLVAVLISSSTVLVFGRTVTPEQQRLQERHAEIWRQNQDRPMRVVRVAKLILVENGVVSPELQRQLEERFQHYVFATELLGARVELVNTIVADNSVIRHDLRRHFGHQNAFDFGDELGTVDEIVRTLRNVDRNGSRFDLIADRNNGVIDAVAFFTDSSYICPDSGRTITLGSAEFWWIGSEFYEYYQGAASLSRHYEGVESLPIVLLIEDPLHGITHQLEGMADMFGRNWWEMYDHFGFGLGWTDGDAERLQLWLSTRFPGFEEIYGEFWIPWHTGENIFEMELNPIWSDTMNLTPENFPAIYTNPSNPEFWHNPNNPVFARNLGSPQAQREAAIWNMMRAFGQPGFNDQGWPTDPIVWLYGVVPFEGEDGELWFYPQEYDYLRWLREVRAGVPNPVPYFEVSDELRAQMAMRNNERIAREVFDFAIGRYAGDFFAATMTRDMAVQVFAGVLWNSSPPEAVIFNVPFSDVNDAGWYITPNNAGLFGSNARGAFRPNDPLTVASAREFMANMARFLGVSPLPASRFEGNANGHLNGAQLTSLVIELFQSAGYFR